MARKYRRDGRGRFAGGSGGSTGSSGGSKGSKGGSGAATKRRAIASNGSKGVKQSKPKASAGARFKRGMQKSAKFAARNPRLIVAVAYGAGVVATGASGRRNKESPYAGMHKAMKYAEGVASNKRGIGGLPGAGLKTAPRTRLRKVHKIRSGI